MWRERGWRKRKSGITRASSPPGPPKRNSHLFFHDSPPPSLKRAIGASTMLAPQESASAVRRTPVQKTFSKFWRERERERRSLNFEVNPPPAMLHAYIREIIRLHICLSLLLLPDQTKTCWRLNVHTVQGRARRISQRIYRDVSYRNAFGQDGGGGAGTQMQQQILYPWPDFSKHPFPLPSPAQICLLAFFSSPLVFLHLPLPLDTTCAVLEQHKGRGRRKREGEAPFYLLLGTVSF